MLFLHRIFANVLLILSIAAVPAQAHDGALKAAVDAVLKAKLDAGDYQKALAAAAGQQ